MGSGTPTEPPSALGADLGRAYVPPAEVGPFSVLDPGRAASLEALVDTLVPGNEHWPTASAAGAAAYVDATAARVPRLRGPLLRGVDALEGRARGRCGRPLSECTQAERSALAAELEASERELFSLVLELTMEAYYRDPAVLEVVRERTAYDPGVPLRGTGMLPFEPALLDRVRRMPQRFPER
jgi:hypothetical protein